MATHARSEDSKAFKKITFEFGGYKVRYAWVSQRGYYPEDLEKANQDCMTCIENFAGDQGVKDCAFFGVFDGHGKTGDGCSHFARDHIPGKIAEQLGKGATMEVAFKHSFEVVNEDLHKSDTDDSMSGTTAITAIIRKGTLYVANVGDSRAIIGEERNSRLVAYPLSADQTPFRKDERERVKAAGAIVANMDQMDGLEPMHENWTEAGQGGEDEDDDTGDPPRVWLKQKMLPGCAFTRSIGDAIGESVGVFAEPEVLSKELCEGDKYIIIASDGVWEFLSNQTVLNMVASYKSPLKACKAVVNEAYKLWLQYDVRTDDITMIAIYLEDMNQLQKAHDEERTRLRAELDSATSVVQKRQASVELRRKSSAFIQNTGGIALGLTGNAKKVESTADDTRPVRRVMTKEKRKMVLANSQDHDAHDWTKVKEEGMQYAVGAKVTAEVDMESITKAVSSNFLLSHLNVKQQKEVFQSMEVCKCSAGNTVIKEGQPGEWFYVVKSGTYQAYIDGALIHTYKYEELAEGGMHGLSFGELALLYNQHARAASIMCSEDGELWRLHAQAFREIVMRSSVQQLLKTLRSVDVLKELSLSQLQRLFDALAELTIAEGEFVIKEGEPGKDFYVIMEGDAKVYKKSSSGEDQEVMALKKFDYFGERALLNDAPRAASVKAISQLKLLQISKQHFEEVLGSLDFIVDQHRRRREEAARRAYLERQAQGLVDANPHEFVPCTLLAEWRVSDIYLVRRKEKLAEDEESSASSADNQKMIVRVVSKKKATEEDLRLRVMAEIKLVGDMLPSPFIPSLLATFSDRSRMYAVSGTVLSMELIYVTNNKPFVEQDDGEKVAQFCVGSMMLALRHLHKQEIVCRMLSLDSVLLDGKGNLQLADFTLSKKLTDCGGRTFTLCGVAEYNAPEQVQKIGHGLAVDWWSLGVFAYELLMGVTPFAPPEKPEGADDAAKAEFKPTTAVKAEGTDDARRESLARKVERRPSVARLLVTTGGGEFEATVATYHKIVAYASMAEPKIEYPKLAKEATDAAKELIEELMDPNPDNRLGTRGGGAFEEFEMHPFFKGLNFTALEDGTIASPFYEKAVLAVTEAYKEADKKLSFDAPSYVGENKWCEDWDYTCTTAPPVGGSPKKSATPAGSGLAAVLDAKAKGEGEKAGGDAA